MELTKKDTKMLQGLSVLAMVCLHLFNRNYEGLFQPLLFIQGTPVSFYISQLSDFCVMGFAFCSGYAHMLLFEQEGYYKKRIRSLFSLMKNFWLILIIFTIVSVVIGQAEFMPGSAMKFLKNALCLENSYNGAWWYMYTYIILVVISPVIFKFIKMSPPMFSLGIGFAIYCVAYLIRFKIPIDNWFLIKFGPFGMTLFEYMLGAVFCERKLFTRIYDKWIKMPKSVRIGAAIGTVAAMLYVRTKIVSSLADRTSDHLFISFLEKATDGRKVFPVDRKAFYEYMAYSYVLLRSTFQEFGLCGKISNLDFCFYDCNYCNRFKSNYDYRKFSNESYKESLLEETEIFCEENIDFFSCNGNWRCRTCAPWFAGES